MTLQACGGANFSTNINNGVSKREVKNGKVVLNCPIVVSAVLGARRCYHGAA
jgi:hypothetical protein